MVRAACALNRQNDIFTKETCAPTYGIKDASVQKADSDDWKKHPKTPIGVLFKADPRNRDRTFDVRHLALDLEIIRSMSDIERMKSKSEVR